MIGFVVIGRNEGERLVRCLGSIGKGRPTVYVDSGSCDDSVLYATSVGAVVVSLDLTVPFTAARARNVGWRRLIETFPEITHVQFIDGDCELMDDWLGVATSFMEMNPHVAVVSGRLRERFPERSVYNWLCDCEWNVPIGKSKACGGVAVVRVKSLLSVKGFRDQMIAGEEPEMCFRLRERGWEIWRLDAEMALHDANILFLSQWWSRARRGGFAFALGASLHGRSPEKYWVRETLSALAWGGLLPLLTVLAVNRWGLIGCLGLLMYPVQFLRVAVRLPISGKRSKLIRAGFLVLGKIPECQGVVEFFAAKVMGYQRGLIEYK